MTNKQLLEIVSSSLLGEKYKKEAINEKEIIIQAEKNGLLPLLFAGVEATFFTKENYQKLEKRFYSYVYNDAKQKLVIEKVKQTFNENKLDHIFLKGTHLKKVYKESYYRQMGDIDVLIKKEFSSASRKIMKEADFTSTSRTAEHDVYFCDNYYVEVHREIYQKESSHDLSPLLKPWDYAVYVEDNLYRFNYAFEGVYLLEHLKKHVLSSGIGLRSILDITIFFNYYEQEIEQKLLQELLEKTNLETFFQTILFINKQAFNLDCKFLKPDFQLSLNDYEEILNYISSSGIHGKGQDFNLMAPRVAKKGKIKTLFRLIFPKWSFMKETYPWLKYLPFLLPIAYLIRSFKYLFLKTKYTFSKLKKVKDSNKEAEALDNLFTKIGL